MTFLSVITAVFILSVLVHLTVERPVANLDRLFLGGASKKKKEKKDRGSLINSQSHTTPQLSAQDDVHTSNQQPV